MKIKSMYTKTLYSISDLLTSWGYALYDKALLLEAEDKNDD